MFGGACDNYIFHVICISGRDVLPREALVEGCGRSE